MDQVKLSAVCAKHPDWAAAKIIVLLSKVEQGTVPMNAARIKIKELESALNNH